MKTLVLLVALSFLLFPTALLGQPRQQFQTVHPVNVFSGILDGEDADGNGKPVPAFKSTVGDPAARWVRLHFKKYHLPNGSYLLLTSHANGASQRLDAISMDHYRNTSAYLKGNRLDVELFVAPGGTGVFFEADYLIVDAWTTSPDPGPPPQIKDLCGADDRVGALDNRIGRISGGCTGWLTSNGAYLTAGHCDPLPVLPMIEFNVPASDPNGTPNCADPNDQYPIEVVDFQDGPGAGQDWMVLRVFPNSNHGQMPVQRYGGFFRMSKDSNPATIRITSFGLDNTPSGPGGGPFYCQDCNATSETEQTDTGNFVGETVIAPDDVYVAYVVDTERGSSGGPVIVEGTNLTIGIHNAGFCGDPDVLANIGTGFENDSLEDAISDFSGLNTVFVDANHPAGLEDGTVLRPFNTFNEGYNTVGLGDTLSVVSGAYVTSQSLSKPMTIVAPVGAIVIDSSALITVDR